MKNRRIFIFIALVVTLGGVILLSFPPEPHYQGRSLTSWLQQCNDTPLDETQRLSEAQTAVRSMPANKVLPSLLELVKAKDDPVSLWMIDLSDKFRIEFLKWHSAEDFQQLGIAGFEVLGTNAAPAVGELAKLLDEKDHTFTAGRCLVFIGKPAETVFCRALTNQDSSIRQWSVDNLAAVTDDVGVYIARIKPRLEDSSEAVRVTTVDAIGIQTSAPELAVPILVAALIDSSDETRLHAINSLANFGTHALVAFPILTDLVSEVGNVAGAALRTLTIIAPDKALPIFTNYFAQRKPGINAALRA
jgi:HEAT repeats